MAAEREDNPSKNFLHLEFPLKSTLPIPDLSWESGSSLNLNLFVLFKKRKIKERKKVFSNGFSLATYMTR